METETFRLDHAVIKAGYTEDVRFSDLIAQTTTGGVRLEKARSPGIDEGVP